MGVTNEAFRMLHRRSTSRCNPLPRLAAAALLTLAWLVVGSSAATAQDGTGDTVINGCMDDLFDGNLGCTANDVRISGVADVTGDDIVDEADITFAPTSACRVGSRPRISAVIAAPSRATRPRSLRPSSWS
jgi:hypothetical protein